MKHAAAAQEPLVEGFNRQHIVTAVVAAVLSIGLHIAGLQYVAGLPLSLPDTDHDPRNRTAETPTPIQLREVAREITGPDRPETLRPSDEALRVEPAREAEEMAEAPGRAGIEPPPLSDNQFRGDASTLASPSELPEPDPDAWQPRQEILTIEQRVAELEPVELERRPLPDIERVVQAPDVVDPIPRNEYAAKLTQAAAETSAGWRAIAVTPPRADISPPPPAPIDKAEPTVVIDEPEAKGASHIKVEQPSEVTPHAPIEALLKASLTAYRNSDKDGYLYFTIAVDRLNPDVLPVLPKDIVFVQDCSGSITEQRLYFCREGLKSCLEKLRPADRFNILAFSEGARACFPDWTKPTEASVQKARAFVDGMTAEGSTDIYRSIRDVVAFNRIPGRPVEAILVTDGLSTAGVTSSTKIIGEFTRLNDGAVSVSTMGTIRSANQFLLDLLSYCNRGHTRIVSSGRWDIAETLVEQFDSIARPVLSGVHFRFADQETCEVYPRLTENLYLDRTLVLHGRCPATATRVVFQAVGQAGDKSCDMVFELPIEAAAESSDRDMPTRWAEQKIYYLIGQYARTADEALMLEIEQTAKRYRVRVPYRDELEERR